MELTGTFEFSHVNMVVINRTTVYKKELVGKKQIPLWHQEHHPKVYKPEDIKEIIQGYLQSPYHRVCPSCDTINIYHKTKKELELEKKAREKLNKDLQKHINKCCQQGKAVVSTTPRNLPIFEYAEDFVKPGGLVTVKMR